jgi:hypothetical protein
MISATNFHYTAIRISQAPFLPARRSNGHPSEGFAKDLHQMTSLPQELTIITHRVALSSLNINTTGLFGSHQAVHQKESHAGKTSPNCKDIVPLDPACSCINLAPKKSFKLLPNPFCTGWGSQ